MKISHCCSINVIEPWFPKTKRSVGEIFMTLFETPVRFMVEYSAHMKTINHDSPILQELILFALRHDGARQVEFLDSVMGQTLGADVSGGLSNKEREDISILYLEVYHILLNLLSNDSMGFCDRCLIYIACYLG